MRRDQSLIDRDVGLVVGRAEEAVECFPRRQPAGRHQLQAIERNVCAAEVDGGDAGRPAGQIGQHVATARGDRHDMAVGLQRQRLEIDLGVLPDLGVYQPAEEALEQPLEKSFAAQRPVAAYRLLEA